MIVDKIDSDSDGLVTQSELKQWIDYTQKRYITDDVKRQWNSHNPKNKPEISWAEYKSVVYGFMDSEFNIVVYLGSSSKWLKSGTIIQIF